jgi:hypothetical protein
MATSDVFTKRRNEKPRPTYTIKSYSINFSFSYAGLYDEATEEARAFERARNLDCKLIRTDYNERSVIVIAPGQYVKVDEQFWKNMLKAHPEMMNNNNYVPGVQTNIYS